MSTLWDEFLDNEGLHFGPDGHSHAGAGNADAAPSRDGDAICDLRHTVLVRVTGDDVEEFLQNQLTNDLQSLDRGHTTLAGYCNPKGRLLCILRAWRNGGGYWLQWPRAIHEACIERLRKYVLRAKVEFDAGRDAVAFGVCGESALEGMQWLGDRLPAREGDLARGERLVIARIADGDGPRFQIAGPVQACIAAWQELRQHATPVGSWTWAYQDIVAGIPTITPDTSEAFIPQMVNLDVLGGVNFQKGCYPGQEIVARMHYLGNLKQRMMRFHVDVESRPAPGDRVYAQDGASVTGTVVDAQPGPDGGWELLAVARIADLDGQTLCLQGRSGPVLTQRPLPYAWPGGQRASKHG